MDVATLALSLATSTLPVPGDQGERPAASPGDLAESVERYLAPYVERGDVLGGVVLCRRGEVIYEGGWQLPDGETPPSFRVASISKTFTAAAIRILADDGKVDVAGNLARYFPDAPVAARITVEQLLEHRSGLADPAGVLPDDVASSALVERILETPLLFEPGTRNRYSNAGYNVLARIIEIVTERDHDAALQELILDPLDLASTASEPSARVAGLVAGHVPAPGGRAAVPFESYARAVGSGSIVSTPRDVARWGVAIASGELFTPRTEGTPYGWGTTSVAGHAGIEQTGLHGGYTSSLTVFPDEQVVVVCLNAVEAGAWRDWSRALSELALGGEVEPPALPQPADRLPADADKLLGAYRKGGTELVVEKRDEHLYLVHPESGTVKYLTPVEGGGFVPRSDSGVIRFERQPDGPAPRFTWSFPTSDVVFEREG